MSRLPGAFKDQAGHCERLGSPFMGQLLRLLAKHWPIDTTTARKFDAWQGDIGPGGASLPLRLAGGLHALVLSGQDDALAAVYPPHQVSDHALWAEVKRALITHDDFLNQWTDNAPQTNEVRRSATLIPAAQLVAQHFDLPLQVSELGASGGLNLMFDRFALETDGGTLGSKSPALTLSPDWRGVMPKNTGFTVASRRGVDLNPLDAGTKKGTLRLLAYLWPDQPERLARTRAAIKALDATVDRDDAISWLEQRLAQPHPGQTHLIYHTIAWQYFPEAAKQRGTSLIEANGNNATDQAPLAWFAFESDGRDDGAAMTLRLWPGDVTLHLGRADFHGRWVNWQQT